MLTYHILYDNGREQTCHSYQEISQKMGQLHNPEGHILGMWVEGTPRGAMIGDSSSKEKLLEFKAKLDLF